MFGIEVLDVVIGLVFIYLLLSLLASIINEIVTSISSSRGANLEKAIGWMLGNEEGSATKWMFDKFVEHPLYKKLKSPTRLWGLPNKPSYLSSSKFSKILTDILLEEKECEADDIQAIRDKFKKEDKAAFEAHDTIRIFLSFLGDAEGLGLQKFEADLEDWFNSVMDRAKGWYKRKIQLYLFIIGLVIAAFLNADAFQMAKTLSIDPGARAEIVRQARDFMGNKATGGIEETPVTINIDSLYARMDVLINEEISAMSSVMGLGWPEREEMNFWSYLVFIITHSWDHLAGWIVTALAISLGAPFWFDLLNKVMKLRATGTQINSNSTGAVG